ncbi:MAG TPA: hypothetical protein VGW74_14720 [Propionibacteriaceae bacterium]|nr:hypothetical protein [Propionibacteriaceae bacterium]
MAYDQIAADAIRDTADAQQRIAAVLADLDQVDATHRHADKAGIDICTHCTEQYTRVLVSWPCPAAELAARIRRTLTQSEDR